MAINYNRSTYYNPKGHSQSYDNTHLRLAKTIRFTSIPSVSEVQLMLAKMLANVQSD